MIYPKLGQFDKALADYEAALTLTKNPNNAEWLYGRGVAKLKKGDTSGGNADIASAKTIKADIAEDYTKYAPRPTKISLVRLRFSKHEIRIAECVRAIG